MPPWGRSLEYRLEPVIKQFNTPPLHIKSVQIHETCLGTCPTILPSLCTATANTLFLFPRSLVQVKDPQVLHSTNLYTRDIHERNYQE